MIREMGRANLVPGYRTAGNQRAGEQDESHLEGGEEEKKKTVGEGEKWDCW